MSIEKSLNAIKDNIAKACKKSNRKFEDVKLIAVTKTVDTDKMNEAINLGVTDIGENKVQEIQRKYDDIDKDVRWHMIGHLQSNKVKYIINNVSLIHSLDRMSLAKEIQKRATENNVNIDVLIQVNIAEEESKFGLKVEEVIPFIESIMNFSNIRIKGLMTMAPYVSNSEEIRWVFRDLKKLSELVKSKSYPNVKMEYLSMGMTNDYEIAIEEGANLVRIGTGIFGDRTY